MNNLLLKMNLAGWSDVHNANGLTMWGIVIEQYICFLIRNAWPLFGALLIVGMALALWDFVKNNNPPPDDGQWHGE